MFGCEGLDVKNEILTFNLDVCGRQNSDTRQTMKPTPSHWAASVKRLVSELS